MDKQKLVTAYNQVSERFIEITKNPKPSYNIDGQEVSWGEYLNQLTKSMESLKKQIDDFRDKPFELAQTMVI